MKIELTPFQQSQPHTCVAACLRSVLEAFGAHCSEEDLAHACNTDLAGATLADAAAGARSLGFNALFIPEATFEALVGWLQQGVAMIVGIAADEMMHGVTGGHAVVVCGIEQGQIAIMDPAIGAERWLELETFLRAWSRRGNRGLVVLR